MWGSYVGAAVIGFWAYSIGTLCWIWGSCIYSRLVILWIIGVGLGFLIGWAIHSFFRALTKVN